jgi:hypothetical protein
MAITVMVDVPEEPAKIWVGVTVLADMLKSAPPALTGTVTVRVRVPLVPVTVTLKLVAVVHPAVRVAVFGVGRVTEAGDIVAVHPLGTTEVTDSEMLPVNPLSAFALMVEVLVFGAVYVMLVGLELRLKSTTWKRIVAVVCVRVPLVPVTVTV